MAMEEFRVRARAGAMCMVVLCYVGCLICIYIAKTTHSWTTTRMPGAPPELDRVSRVGLLRYTAMGECATEECSRAWMENEAEATKQCEGFINRKEVTIFKALAQEGYCGNSGSYNNCHCEYHRKGYCLCPYIVGAGHLKFLTPHASCKSNETDLAEEDALYYAERSAGAKDVAFRILHVTTFIMALALCTAPFFLKHAADEHVDKDKEVEMFVLPLIGTLPLLALLIATLVLGTRYIRMYHLAPYCGSQRAWDRANAARPEAERLEVDWFGLGPTLCLAGCLSLALVWLVVGVALVWRWWEGRDPRPACGCCLAWRRRWGEWARRPEIQIDDVFSDTDEEQEGPTPVAMQPASNVPTSAPGCSAPGGPGGPAATGGPTAGPTAAIECPDPVSEPGTPELGG